MGCALNVCGPTVLVGWRKPVASAVVDRGFGWRSLVSGQEIVDEAMDGLWANKGEVGEDHRRGEGAHPQQQEEQGVQGGAEDDCLGAVTRREQTEGEPVFDRDRDQGREGALKLL